MATLENASSTGKLPANHSDERAESSSSEITSLEKILDNEKRGSTEQTDGGLNVPCGSQVDHKYLHGIKLVAVVACLMLAVFCVALDNTSQFLSRPEPLKPC